MKLITMLIVHHAGQAYSPHNGVWPIFIPTRVAILDPFFTVNASFGLELFFLIAGYFVPAAYDKKGTPGFLKEMRGFQKERNMRRNPKVTLLCYDPCHPLRFIEVRGTVVEMTEVGAMEHLDSLSELYVGRSPYFGACVSAELKGKETPVLCRTLPTHVETPKRMR